MKIIILAICLATVSLQQVQKGSDIIGSNSNTGNKSVEAVSYDAMSVPKDPNPLQTNNYIQPKIVNSIAKEKGYEKSEDHRKVIPTISSSHVKSNLRGEYYDGTRNIRARSENCSQFNTDPKSCTDNAHCGWCEEPASCMPGTKEGPLNDCKKENYKFFAPLGKWNAKPTSTVPEEYQQINN